MAASAYLNKALQIIESQIRFKGGVTVETLAATYTFSAKSPNLGSFDPNGSNRNMQLEAEELCEGFFGIYHNAGSSGNLVFLNDAAGTVVTLGSSEWCVLMCDGTSWKALSSSAFADLLASANTWDLLQTFTVGIDNNGTLDQDTALTGTGDAANISATMSHASQSAEGLDVALAQITNARTSGVLSAIKSTIVSLTGSTAGTDVYAYEAAVTVGEAAVDHFAFRLGAGFDAFLDASAAATGETDILVGANLADAWTWRGASLNYSKLVTTTATPGWVHTFTQTDTGDAESVALVVNDADGTSVGVRVSAAQTTTPRTSGTVSGVKSSVTSLSGDTAGVDYYCYEAAVTVGEAGADHFVLKVGAGFDAVIDSSSCATGENDWLMPANVAEAHVWRGSALTYLALVTTTATPGINETFTQTATGNAHSIAGSFNSASSTSVGLAASATQITTPRTSGTVTGVRGAVTSLSGDAAGVDYYAFEAAVTVGEAAADHFVLKQGAGFDWTIDSSAAATGEAGWMMGANKASALKIGTESLPSQWIFSTTTASPGLAATLAHTGTAAGLTITETINHATQVAGGFDANVTQLSTARTGGYAYGYRAKTTSLAGDLNGVPYAGYYVLAPTDGGGAVLHTGLYVEAGNDYSVHGLDNVSIAFGTGVAGVADITAKWDGTDLVWGQLTANSAIKWGVDGAGMDQVWYGDTASAKITWDQSADTLLLEGVAKIKAQTIAAATGTAIPVTHSGSFPITQNGAETNTLADPTFIGQWLSIFVDTDTSGARVITAASRINQAGNTIITLTEAGDFIKLEAITIAGALKWQVVANDGAVLS